MPSNIDPAIFVQALIGERNVAHRSGDCSGPRRRSGLMSNPTWSSPSMSPKQGGPTKYTPAVGRVILETIRAGAPYPLPCSSAGVRRVTSTTDTPDDTGSSTRPPVGLTRGCTP